MLKPIDNLIKKSSIQQRATITYMIASIFTQGINFFTLPIYTRLLTTSDMGIVTTFVSLYSIIYPIATLSLSANSMSIGMVEFEKRRDQYQSVCLIISSCSTIFAVVLYCFAKKILPISEIFPLPILIILFLLLLFQPALDSWYVRERYEYKYRAVLIVSIFTSLLSMLGPIFCIVIAKTQGILDLANIRLIAQYGGIILVSGVVYCVILKRGKCYFEKNMVIFALKMSIPLIFQTLAKNLLDTSDRLMIAKICGNSEAGIYGTVYNVSMISLIVWNAMNSAIVPYVFENLKVNKYQNVERITLKVLIVFSIISVFVTLVAPEILYILTTEEYYSAMYMIPAIAAGIYFTAVYGIYGNMLLFAKKSAYIMFSTCFAAAINIILNYIFIGKFGYSAAAYTTLISFILLACVQGIMQILVFGKIVVSTKKVILISVITTAICLMCNYLYTYIVIRYLLLFLVGLLLFTARQYLKKIWK